MKLKLNVPNDIQQYKQKKIFAQLKTKMKTAVFQIDMI